MVGLATDNMPKPVDFCEDDVGVDELLTALSSRDGNTIWIPAGSNLSNVLVKLPKYPGMTLVEVGPATKTGGEEPVYVARAIHKGSIIPAYCGFHLQGARMILDGREVVVPLYDVLVSKPEEYQWQEVVDRGAELGSRVNGALCGGIRRSPEGVIDHLAIGRWRGEDGQWMCGPIEADDAPQRYHAHGTDSKLPNRMEVLTRAGVASTVLSSLPGPMKKHEAAVTLGAYWTDNHWSHVRPGGHDSAAFHFTEPLRTVPRIIVGLSKLDMGHDADAAAVRVRSWPQNVTREGFICNAQTWSDTSLYNASVDWAAIEERDWQCGVFRTTDIREPWADTSSLFNHRITFQTPFPAPPIMLVCFNGFDLRGNWDIRTYATNVDHTGFNLSIVKTDGSEVPSELCSAFITWLALPGDELLKRGNAWIGQFSTDAAGNVAETGDCRGHVDFGVKFQRPPKVFLGLNHFRLRNTENLRLYTAASNVTESGMDWKIWKWDVTVLEGASVMYLAVDGR